MESNLTPLQLAQSSLKYFTTRFLKHRWPSHYQEWNDFIQKYDRILVQAPRGHGKSAYWALSYPLWRVIRGKRQIVMFSFSENQARKLVRDIREVVETNPYLEHLRPTTKEIWGTDMLSFANGSTISVFGFGTSSRGLHPDDIIVDDPLKDLGGMSDEDQERTYFGVITGMAMEKTKLCCIGTPVNFGDLLEKLEKNEAYARWKRPAMNSKGEPLFPELWSARALNLKRIEMGSLNFAREYLLERIDPSTQPFKRQYETTYREAPIRFSSIVTFCDPAYTENDGDYTAIVTVGFTGGNHAYVLESKALRREDPGEIVRELFKTINAFKPQVVGIEKKKGQALHFSFQEARTRQNRWDFKYVEISHGGNAKGSDPRIGGLVPRWEARTIHVHPEMKQLLEQIYAYRIDDKSKLHDDLVDALAYCFHEDMAQPNSGPQSVPLDEEEMEQVGRGYYGIGAIVGSYAYNNPSVNKVLNYGQMLANRMDARIGDK